jgi:hypothetical protein
MNSDPRESGYTVYLQCRFAYKDGEVQGLDPKVPYEFCPQGVWVQCTCSADLRTKTERSRALILRSRMNSDPRGRGYTVPEVQIYVQRRRGPGP